jgi:signal peptidase I
MSSSFWEWVFADPEDKSLQRELIEIGILYTLFVMIAYFFDDVPLRWALITTVALVVAFWEGGREIIRIGLMAAVIVFGFIRPFCVQAFYIPSRSMENTLLINDHIFVNKFVYRFTEPDRWDIAVFEYPNQRNKDYIKRLAGLPGDTLALREHRVYINGEPVRREFVRNEVELQLLEKPQPIAEDLPPELIRFRGDALTLNGRMVLSGDRARQPVRLRASLMKIYREAGDHRVKEIYRNGTGRSNRLSESFGPIRVPEKGYTVDLSTLEQPELGFYYHVIKRHSTKTISIRDGILYRGGVPLNEYTVPEDMYFFLGDNRDHSEDSRVWGFVPRRMLLGEAFFIYWPPSRVGVIGD